MFRNTTALNRRDFVSGAAGFGAALGLLVKPGVASQGRVPGANDKINLGVIGMGGRGAYVGARYADFGEKTNTCRIAAVCDVWQKRVTASKERFRCDGYLDHREIINRGDIDAVIIATPDHWHATMALEAMAAGKDVYLEKPMCHTIDEARRLVAGVRDSKRILQVGSQTTSADQWYKAKKAIAEGMIGKMIMSQGSYHRNSTEGEWNWKIDPNAGPDGKGDNYLDWKSWLGPAPKRNWDPDRYFRFRKYWDYSGGIATDLFYHVVAPLNICWDEPQFPYKVTAGGNKYIFTNDREVPDTFHLIGEYSKGHSIVLSSSMANSQHVPGLIRGHEGSIIMVEHGEFERPTEFITVRPETDVISDAYRAKFGADEIKIPVDKTDMMEAHIKNFLECVRSRRKPNLDVETGAKAQVLISMSVQAYQEGRVLYFDERTWKVTPKPPKA